MLSRNESQQINAVWLHSSQSRSFSQSLNSQSSSLSSKSHFRIRSKVLLKGSKFQIPVQDFIVSVSPSKVEMRNQPKGNFPKIELIANLNSPNVDIGIGLSDTKTVESQILYTRLFFAINESKSIVLLDRNEIPLEITTEQGFRINSKQMEYRAKLFRKLSFIEKFFNTKFYLPNLISEDEVRILEVVYRGLTEGEFLIAVGDFIKIPNFQIDTGTLRKPPFSKYGRFSYKIESEEIALFGKYLSVGKISVDIEKSGIANPQVIHNLKDGDIVPQIKLSVFDFQIKHRFEKYTNNEKLLRNKQKLERFKKELKNEESDILVNLIDEPLTEILGGSAVEIVEGILQFYDFPDRFSVLNPKLEENQWRVPIALTYRQQKPIWLEDAFVDVKTGKVEMKISFDKLLKKGKKKAKEVFSIA